jgi:hypothetical protein
MGLADKVHKAAVSDTASKAFLSIVSECLCRWFCLLAALYYPILNRRNWPAFALATDFELQAGLMINLCNNMWQLHKVFFTPLFSYSIVARALSCMNSQ